jgi:speckle-type POZ protein
MAASQSQRAGTMTASRSTVVNARATHKFEITGYSQHKGLDRYVRSATFTVDGYDWCIAFHPEASFG